MRRTNPIIYSTVSIAALIASPAFAQTESQIDAAQDQNVAVDCSTVPEGPQREECLRTEGEGAVATAGGAPPEGAIVVTGSRISRPNYDTIQPATVLNSEAIEQRGFVNAADALNELPQFGIPGSSPVGAGQGGAFGTGQSFINFLGLGSQRTLVLVNGRRFVSSNNQSLFQSAAPGVQVDLGLINTKLIERIETIAIGGAPIYGSDAIAGTVNIILKSDYEGADVDFQSGISSRGDAQNYRIRGIAGRNFLDGRANLTFSAEYNAGKGLVYADREVLRRGLFYADCPEGSQFNQCVFENGPRVNATTPGGAPLVGDVFPLSPEQMETLVGLPGFLTWSVENGSGNELMFDEAGNLIPIDYGVTPGGGLFSSGGNGFAYIVDTSQVLSDTKRWNANLIGHIDVTDNIRLFGEGWYSYSKSTNLQTQPEYNSGIFGSGGSPNGNLILSVNNPFLTAEQRALIAASIENNPLSDRNIGCTFGDPDACGDDRPEQDYFYLSRANVDLNNGRATYEDRVFRIVGGLDGKFDLLAGQWNWEIVGNYGRSKGRGKSQVINTQNFFNALGVVTEDNPNGIPCLAGLDNSPYPTQSATCAPLNVFGSGRASPEALAYILIDEVQRVRNTQRVLTADISGPVFTLPGGNLSLALGVEARRETSKFTPSADLRGPDADPLVDEDGDGDPTNDITSYSQFAPVPIIQGKFNTKEVFGELNADIISPNNDITGIYRLDVQAAARHVDNSIAGGDWTYTVGGRYAPIRDISFRGNFTHAIRSPSIQEAFIPTSQFFSFATDPCDQDNIGNGPDPATRAANCAAAGIVQPFNATSDDASFTQSTGGNLDLANEVSDAFSVGAVLTPRFIPGLTISGDYIKVTLNDAIANFTANQVLNACYDSSDYPSNEFCDRFTRSTTPGPTFNQLTFVSTTFFNAARLRYRGLVFAWDYKLKTPFLGSRSSLGVSGSYQRLLELTTVNTEGSAPINSDGTLGYPKNSWTATVNYLNGPWSFFANVNYTGRVTQGTDEADDFRQFQRLKPFVSTNAGFSVNVAERFRFFADVDNIFDKKPPFPVPAFGGSVTYFPGVMGRYFRFGAGVSF